MTINIPQKTHDFECNYCGAGYDKGDGKWAPQIKAWVCENCYWELDE